MPIRFVLDENISSRLLRAIERHNLAGEYPLEVVKVGVPPDLPLGADDSEILAWAEKEQRILVTLDKKTMPEHMKRHVEKGRRSPGVLCLHASMRVADVIEYLVLVAYASDAGEWENRVWFVP